MYKASTVGINKISWSDHVFFSGQATSSASFTMVHIAKRNATPESIEIDPLLVDVQRGPRMARNIFSTYQFPTAS
jgi:hypothetical protein